MNRAQATAGALDYFDSGRFHADLARRVAIETESQESRGDELHGRARTTRPRFATTRVRMPARLLTGRIAFLIYGLLLGMLLWAVLRAVPRLGG